MWQITPAQMQKLRDAIQQRLRAETIENICSHLCQKAPEILAGYTWAQQRLIIGEVVDTAREFGIVDPDHVLNWSYIRFLINIAFYKMAEFKDILDHPYLHPYSKGRHIVLAFFCDPENEPGECTLMAALAASPALAFGPPRVGGFWSCRGGHISRWW
jgi:hypothetical protein